MKESIKFICSCVSKEQWPRPIKPVVAVIGRSNVGKSSLINSLLGVKIAKISSKPGKTQTLNFYLYEQRYYFVDLPGYGYAKLSQSKKEFIRRFVEQFLEEYPDLRTVVLLIDSRLDLQANDKIMVDYLNTKEVPYLIVLTKFDKVKKTKHLSRIRYFQSIFSQKKIIPFSIKTKEGHKELLTEIKQCLKS